MNTPHLVPGAPPVELSRSPAAAIVGRLAAASGLRLAHFEHRAHLDWPPEWVPEGRPDLRGGAHLAEHKYSHHRNDNAVGSFNPSHRAKWTAHELCHGLVGFAWRPDATPFFHALSARLSEVLPVALWYFLDEAGLRRCPEHDGPLFGASCEACEVAAAMGPIEVDPRWLREGRAFVDRELAAVARARRLGRPVGHRFATLDLGSDALAYASSHGARLRSPAFGRYMELFHPDDALGGRASLDALADRVERLTGALCGDDEAAPLVGGAERVVAQDLGWRLLVVAADCEGEAAGLLDGFAARLATTPGDVAAVVAAYREAAEAWWLPEVERVFGVGYPLPGGLGRDAGGLALRLAASCPNTEAVLGEAFASTVAEFAEAEPWQRGAAARRFARWLAITQPGPVADLARYEAACAHPLPSDAWTDGLGGAPGPVETSRGVEILRLGVDADAFVRALDGGGEEGVERPTVVAVRRQAGGDVVVAEISEAAAAALERAARGPVPRAELGLLDAEVRSLETLGVLRPARWAEISGGPAQRR